MNPDPRARKKGDKNVRPACSFKAARSANQALPAVAVAEEEKRMPLAAAAILEAIWRIE